MKNLFRKLSIATASAALAATGTMIYTMPASASVGTSHTDTYSSVVKETVETAGYKGYKKTCYCPRQNLYYPC